MEIKLLKHQELLLLFWNVVEFWSSGKILGTLTSFIIIIIIISWSFKLKMDISKRQRESLSSWRRHVTGRTCCYRGGESFWSSGTKLF